MRRTLIVVFGLVLIAGSTTGCKQSTEESSSESQTATQSASSSDQESLKALVESMEISLEDFSDELEDEVELEDTIENIDDIAADEVVDIENDIDPIRPDVLKACVFPAKKRMCVSNGARSAKFSHFNNCLLVGRSFLASGHVKLTYNNARCGIRQDGMSVHRTYNLDLTPVLSGDDSFQVTSEALPNYLGEEIGGGEILENTDGGWKLTVSGRNMQKFSPEEDRPVGFISLETKRPIVISGSLHKARRKINGGVLAVHHNLAKYTTTYTANDLIWNGTCKCPLSGTLDIDITGSQEANGSIYFNGCGKAIIQRNDNPREEVELANCSID